jgi:hypothetical protein
MRINSHSFSKLISAIALLIAAPVVAQDTRPQDSKPQAVVATEYHPTNYSDGYGRSFYPATELRALPPTAAQAAAAKAELSKAESALSIAVVDVLRAYKRSPELREAIHEERQAWAEYKAARENALADLKTDPVYQAAVTLRDMLGNDIARARENDETTLRQLMVLAQAKLSYAGSVSAMDAAAAGADPAFQSARKRLIEAGQRLTDLRNRFDDAVRSDSAVLAARKAVSEARVAVVATSAMYAEARTVASIALDYAYHLSNQTYPYIVNSPYADYGYRTGGYPSGGYTFGYPVGYPLIRR